MKYISVNFDYVYLQSPLFKTKTFHCFKSKYIVSLQKRMKILTLFLCKLMQETRFSYTHITNDNVFKDVRIVIRATRRHDDDSSKDT